MAAKWEHHVHLGTNTLDQPPNFGQIAGTVEGAVAWADDVHPWPLAFFAFAFGDVAQTVLLPQPEHRAIGALPLVLVDGAWQKALKVGAFGRDAATDHFGNRAGDHDGGQIWVQGRVGSAHGAFGAFAPELFFGQAGDDDGQLVWRQRVGIMQH